MDRRKKAERPSPINAKALQGGKERVGLAERLFSQHQKDIARIARNYQNGIVPTLTEILQLERNSSHTSKLGIRALRAKNSYRKKAQFEARNAGSDSLTGLPNLLSFQRETKRTVATVNRLLRHEKKASAYFGFVDLDEFKSTNDNAGHAAGDLQLQYISEGLHSVFERDTDTVFRLHGDELAIILFYASDPTEEEFGALNRKALEAVRYGSLIAKAVYARQESDKDKTEEKKLTTLESIFLSSVGNVTASMGWARYDGSVPIDEVISQADSNMYAAKKDGGNQYFTDIFITAKL